MIDDRPDPDGLLANGINVWTTTNVQHLMARLESGRIALNLQWQPLEEVVGSAPRSLGGLFAGRHPIKVALPADLPLLRSDAVLIERVPANLPGNAAKHTAAGSAISVDAGDPPRIDEPADDADNADMEATR